MADFSKRIKVVDLGIVSAEVFDGDGKRVDLKMVFPLCFTLQAKLKSAHRWADRTIALCIEHRVGEMIAGGRHG